MVKSSWQTLGWQGNLITTRKKSYYRLIAELLTIKHQRFLRTKTMVQMLTSGRLALSSFKWWQAIYPGEPNLNINCSVKYAKVATNCLLVFKYPSPAWASWQAWFRNTRRKGCSTNNSETILLSIWPRMSIRYICSRCKVNRRTSWSSSRWSKNKRKLSNKSKRHTNIWKNRKLLYRRFRRVLQNNRNSYKNKISNRYERKRLKKRK